MIPLGGGGVVVSTASMTSLSVAVDTVAAAALDGVVTSSADMVVG